MAGRPSNDDICPANVAEARSRFDLFSDHALATRMQQGEFDSHYSLNRNERQLVGSDTKTSRVVQVAESQRGLQEYRGQLAQIEESDEAVARRLQEQFNQEVVSEEERAREARRRQAADDEALARELQQRETGRIVGYGSTERDVDGQATRRPSPPHGRAPAHHDEATQNDINSAISSSLVDFGVDVAARTYPSHTSLPIPPALSRDDPFASPEEYRSAAYAPSASVPLLPTPLVPMSLHGNAAAPVPLLGLATTTTVPPSTSAPSFRDDAAPPPYHAPPLPYPSTTSTVPYPTAGLPYPTGAPPQTLAQTAPSVNPTNPFLVDISSMAGAYSAQPPPGYRSEFGLPPPSNLAMGGGYGGYPARGQ